MRWLIGETGYSFFDEWTLVCLVGWTLVGLIILALQVNRTFAILCCVSVSISWEIVDRIAEKAWPSAWHSPESWWNSWLSDPLTVVIGLGAIFYVFDKWRTLKRGAR